MNAESDIELPKYYPTLADMAAQIEVMRQALEFIQDNVSYPEPNCNCCISPPCNDCVDNSGTREGLSIVEHALALPEIHLNVLAERDAAQKKAIYRECFDDLARLLEQSMFSIKQDGRSVKSGFIKTLREPIDKEGMK